MSKEREGASVDKTKKKFENRARKGVGRGQNKTRGKGKGGYRREHLEMGC